MNFYMQHCSNPINEVICHGSEQYAVFNNGRAISISFDSYEKCKVTYDKSMRKSNGDYIAKVNIKVTRM